MNNPIIPSVIALISLFYSTLNIGAQSWEPFEYGGATYSYTQYEFTPGWVELTKYDNPTATKCKVPEMFNKNLGASDNIIRFVVESIGYDAFASTSNLKTVIIPESVRRIGDRAFWKSGIEDTNFPMGLQFLGAQAFYSSNLTSVRIPSSIQYIGPGCFAYCRNLKSVDLPATLTRLNGQTFAMCNNIEQLICRNPTPPLVYPSDFGETVNYDTYEWNASAHIDFDKCVLYVPAESIWAYREADCWSWFEDIRPIPSDVNSVSIQELTRCFSYEVNNHMLSINAFEDCHIKIVDNQGLECFSQKCKAGESIDFNGNGIYLISSESSEVVKVLL